MAGPNGSGKTTLIKLIVDLLKIQEGSISINKTSHDNPSVKKEIIYLSSEDFLPDFLTGK
ncbi:ATP-binding cassette domain-containing protein [Oceanobacillus caeni]|uniref:ATP-binding cassette domain-containing protein n=1 Tax=Oceanobacillus caeni TaxID=405946 RepID=UPI0009FB373B